jgi:Asp-tRNA(Asn)/Glu-tRNA(Gln) amidotransferase A subunit family amidase
MPQGRGRVRRRTGELDGTIPASLLAGAAVTADGPAWPITHALQVGPLDDYHRAWGAAQPRSAEFMMPMDLAGVPALCMPCGFSADGLPYSLRLTGRRLSEAMLCRVAFAYEQASDWRRHHPTVRT